MSKKCLFDQPWLIAKIKLRGMLSEDDELNVSSVSNELSTTEVEVASNQDQL